MPMQRHLYPKNWDEIAKAIKDGVNWVCQGCGKQCRRPGEPFDTHRNTLTVAHLDHTPANCSPENLKALCAPCHLRYDAPRKAADRRRKKASKQMLLLEHPVNTNQQPENTQQTNQPQEGA